jgi:hypothetical protein
VHREDRAQFRKSLIDIEDTRVVILALMSLHQRVFLAVMYDKRLGVDRCSRRLHLAHQGISVVGLFLRFRKRRPLRESMSGDTTVVERCRDEIE